MNITQSSLKLKNVKKALIIALVLIAACSFISFFSLAQQRENILNHVLRLHVPASSDTSEDQELRLYVRNRILTESAGMLDGITDRREAEQVMRQNMPRFKAAAVEEVTQRGYQHPVDVELENIYLTTRHHQQVTLPTSTHDVPRVTTGQAQGKNWWCVVFSPMRLPVAEEEEELDNVLNPQQAEIATGQHKIRFKPLELCEQLKNRAAGK